MRLLFLFCGTLLLLQCQRSAPSSTLSFSLSAQHQVQVLDSLQAAKAIVQDTVEHYFQRVSALDMSIQMQRNYPPDTERAAILTDYRQFLQSDVADFSAKEIAFVQDVFKDAFRQMSQLPEAVFPANICLLKTKGRHYGNSVYYTRQHCIVIPANVLVERNASIFLETMLHEIFHIYSRYHPEQRQALYRLIGFEDIGTFSDVQLPPALAERYLLNPDGIDFAEAIELKLAVDSSVLAVPIIFANKPEFESSMPDFMSYLEFELFPVQQTAAGPFTVLAQADGTSPLNMQELDDFYAQIGNNTDYIIHPDEILADNFVLLVLQNNSNQLSEQGQDLLLEMERILRKH